MLRAGEDVIGTPIDYLTSAEAIDSTVIHLKKVHCLFKKIHLRSSLVVSVSSDGVHLLR